jgi:long-chain fatty acid transport protein
VLAYQLNSGLSLAVGYTFNDSEVTIKRRIGLLQDDQFRFEGDGVASGFTLGVLWQPVPEWSFGLNYRSATEIDYEGDSIAEPYDGKRSTEVTLVFPDHIVGGVSYRPNEQWNFEFNLDWTNWDQVNDTVFKGTTGGDQVFAFRYDSGLLYPPTSSGHPQSAYSRLESLV